MFKIYSGLSFSLHVLSALGVGPEEVVTSDIAMVKILLFRDNSRALMAVQCQYVMKNSRIYNDTSFLFIPNEKKRLRWDFVMGKSDMT